MGKHNKFNPSDEDIAEIIRLYQVEANSYLTISKSYNVSRHTIERLLKRHNIPARTPKPKYKSPYAKGMNPNSHGGANSRTQSNQYMHDLGQYRYKDRLYPARCMFIKRNQEQCKKYCTPGARTCYYHGGRVYKLKIKTGSTSKILKRNIMHFLTQLSKTEIQAISSTDYNQFAVLDYQNKLSDILLARALKFLNESEQKLESISLEIQDHKEGKEASQSLTGLLITQASLLKNITTTHTIIQKHQEQISKNLVTQDQIIGSKDVKDSLNELTINVSKDSLNILTDLIQSYLAAGALESVDAIKNLLPAQSYIPVKYEELED